MCILFLYVATPRTTSSPHVKLIIASNRDEAYARPTAPAKFWDTDPNILAGQDLKDKGTWLGISKSGKIATLLNIMSKAPTEKIKSRGELVTGFLRSDSSLRGWTYCNNLHQDDDLNIRNHFGLFNLLTIDLQLLSITGGNQSSSRKRYEAEVTYFTNARDSGPQILTESESEIFAFGNSTYENPFCKVSHGCKDFDQIIQAHKDICLTETGKSKFKEATLDFLKSQERHYPDEQMNILATKAGQPATKLPELSSIFVKTTNKIYGTRTHTIIIVDSDNNVNFHEWTLEEPINIDSQHWIESEYNFKVLS